MTHIVVNLLIILNIRGFSPCPWSTIPLVHNLGVSSWMRHGGLVDANDIVVTETEERFLAVVDDEPLENRPRPVCVVH